MRKAILSAISVIAMLTPGCTGVTEGWQQGLEDGVSAAIAAAIEAPIQFLLDRVFAAEPA